MNQYKKISFTFKLAKKLKCSKLVNINYHYIFTTTSLGIIQSSCTSAQSIFIKFSINILLAIPGHGGQNIARGIALGTKEVK